MDVRSFPLERFRLYENRPSRTRVKDEEIISISLYAFGPNSHEPAIRSAFLASVCVKVADGECPRIIGCIRPKTRGVALVSANQTALARIWLRARIAEVRRNR